MPDSQLFQHALVLILALIVTGIVQLMSVRFSGGSVGAVASLFLGFAVGFAVLLFGEIYLALWCHGARADSVCLGLANAVLFICCWYFYFHYINIGEASLRIRILREIAAVPACSPEKLLASYNTRVVVAARMARLVADGQLLYDQGRFHAGKPRMVVVAKAFAALRWLLLGKTSRT